MHPFQILIVDDQRDARRVLRAGMETLEGDLSITDVPSGEEAMLVISRQPIDLLIADVRLPGISGLELQERARARNPGLKIILITGVEDQRVRKQVKNAGAEAYFYKPVGMDEFLQAVSRCLSLELPEQREPDPDSGNPASPALSTLGISDRLSILRQELQADCTILTNEDGQILAQSGNLALELEEKSMIQAVMSALTASARLSHLVDAPVPKDLLLLSGRVHDLAITHVGQAMGLVVIAPAGWGKKKKPENHMKVLQEAARDLQEGLSQLWLPLETQAASGLLATPFESPQIPEEAESIPDLAAIFDQIEDLGAINADNFWESALENGSEQVAGADTISYDQARQLGLAPQEE